MSFSKILAIYSYPRHAMVISIPRSVLCETFQSLVLRDTTSQLLEHLGEGSRLQQSSGRRRFTSSQSGKVGAFFHQSASAATELGWRRNTTGSETLFVDKVRLKWLSIHTSVIPWQTRSLRKLQAVQTAGKHRRTGQLNFNDVHGATQHTTALRTARRPTGRITRRIVAQVLLAGLLRVTAAASKAPNPSWKLSLG